MDWLLSTVFGRQCFRLSDVFNFVFAGLKARIAINLHVCLNWEGLTRNAELVLELELKFCCYSLGWRWFGYPSLQNGECRDFKWVQRLHEAVEHMYQESCNP